MVDYPRQPGEDKDGVADPRLTDEEWELLKRCEDIRGFVDKILDFRMRIAYDIGWVYGVTDCTRQWGPQGSDDKAIGQRMMQMVMTEHGDPPLYGEGSQ